MTMNNLCYSLNRMRLVLLAAIIRLIAAVLLPLRQHNYSQPQAGYRGWLETKLGVVAFVREDGSLQWVW